MLLVVYIANQVSAQIKALWTFLNNRIALQMYSISAIALSATTWTNACSASIAYIAEYNNSAYISYSSYQFTIIKTGRYKINYSIIVNGNANNTISFRLRRTNNTPATLLQRTNYCKSSNGLDGFFFASAGDIMQIQYCNSATNNNSFASVNVNGEQSVTSRLLFEV